MEWIKVSEKLPDPHTYILCYDKRRGITKGKLLQHPEVPLGEMWQIDGKSGGIGTRFAIFPPTHWKPMPVIPKDT